ncbi:hypothetical protein [Streptomyces albus]|uniref:hypothetical protein n=1 Tax=Streptomyces albus TaxID=1888 RepID=UPI003F1C6572
MPLLLSAYQHHFAKDLDAMSRHLIDDVAICWDELGTDLLADAPDSLITALTGGQTWPSRTPEDVITPDGSPPQRMTVTERTARDQDLQWGYVLHPQGIEVISVTTAHRGILVNWSTDPRTRFSDDPIQWTPAVPRTPCARQQPSTSHACADTTPAPPRSTSRH